MNALWTLIHVELLTLFVCIVAVFWAIKKLGNWVSEIQSDVTESQAAFRSLQAQINNLQRLLKQKGNP
jgi:hypothetical protein